MINRSRLRMVLAVAFAITAVGALAAPAAAESALIPCNGNCGYYENGDGGPPYGSNCQYEAASYDLDKMSPRPPLMHGSYSFKTKVDWRFKILRRAPAGGAYQTIYTSSYQNAMADDSIPARAGHGFSRRTWMAPENPTGRHKVWIEMRWWYQGAVEGFARVEIDNYKRLWSGNVDYTTEYCLQDW